MSISNDTKNISSKLDSLKTYSELSSDSKKLQNNKGNPFESAIGDASSQLNKLKEQQKRFQRNVPTSMDSLMGFLGQTRGNGSETMKYLRQKIFQTLVKMEPKAKEILVDGAMKTLGCSQEQTYEGFQLPALNPIPYIQSLPVSKGIYIPVSSIDFSENLKIGVDSMIGKFFYEKEQPSTDTKFKPYGGKTNYPFNKMLNLRMDSTNVSRTYSTEFGNFYNGISEQKLLDVQYTTTNDLGTSGDYFRVFLLDRNNSFSNLQDFKGNKVKEFLVDYYSTVKLVDPVNVVGSVLNSISNFASIKANVSYKKLSNDSKFEIILQRILGLCNDSRREIDVSGVAKVPELDGVDDSFFEFTEVDLRNINNRISNIQKGIVKFESCGDVELPVNPDIIIDELINFRDSVSGNTPEQNVIAIEKVIDSFIDNPNWAPLIPNGVKLDVEINKNIIKNITKAVASGILTPKILLPIFTLLYALEASAKNKINNYILTANTFIGSANTYISSANTYLQSGNTLGQQVDNIIDDAVDFLKKFKTFCIDMIQRINAEFLKELFEVLKKDILNLINILISDIQKSAAAKKYTIILRLVQLGLIIGQTISDYRKCKSLINDILNLLNLINSVSGASNKIPTPLLPLTQGLPGFSPERAATNALENLQKLGMPTGALPDGSPNLMNQFMSSILKGSSQEEAENGTIDAMVIVPPLTGGLLQVFGKNR
jgi:hypothetical protein